jgi:hypothetical protein
VCRWTILKADVPSTSVAMGTTTRKHLSCIGLPVRCRVSHSQSVLCLFAPQPGPDAHHPDNWYGLRARTDRGITVNKRSTWQWSVYLKSRVHKRLLCEVGVELLSRRELGLGQVKIYRDCHPDSATASKLAYRVAALRYGSVQSLQQLYDWWGTQWNPKNPDQVRLWLYNDKVSCRLCPHA